MIHPQLCSYVYVVTRSTEILMTGWSTGQSSYRPTRKMCLIKSISYFICGGSIGTQIKDKA